MRRRLPHSVHQWSTRQLRRVEHDVYKAYIGGEQVPLVWRDETIDAVFMELRRREEDGVLRRCTCAICFWTDATLALICDLD